MFPSFNYISLYFCLHDASLNMTHLRNSLLANLLALVSSWERGPSLSLESQNPTWFKVIPFLIDTLPNTSLFHAFMYAFKAFNFVANMKLGELWNYPPTSNEIIKSSFNHIFSNKKETTPLLSLTPSSKIGIWSKIGFGRELWTTLLSFPTSQTPKKGLILKNIDYSIPTPSERCS